MRERPGEGIFRAAVAAHVVLMLIWEESNMGRDTITEPRMVENGGV